MKSIKSNVQVFQHSSIQVFKSLGKPSLKKTILLLTFVNKDFSPPPLIIDEKPLRFGGPVRGVTPPPL